MDVCLLICKLLLNQCSPTLQIAERGGLGKKRQKKENPLSCVICKSAFTSLEEMKEHVRNPCSKPPPEPKAEALAPPNPELENFEQQLQQLQEAKGEDIATNQIESLLRAAQALHQQQQEQQRQQAEQLQSKCMCTLTSRVKCFPIAEVIGRISFVILHVLLHFSLYSENLLPRSRLILCKKHQRFI